MSSDSEENEIRSLAYSYSQKKKYLNCTEEENWFRAVKQIRGPEPTDRSLIEMASERIRSPSELAGRFFSLITVLSTFFTALGALSLVSYVHSVGAALPPIDTSFGILVLSLAWASASGLLLILLFFLAPFVITRLDDSLYDNYPTFFYWNPLVRDHRSDYLKQYLIYFMPCLLGLSGQFPAYYLGGKSLVIVLCFALGCVLPFFMTVPRLSILSIIVSNFSLSISILTALTLIFPISEQVFPKFANSSSFGVVATLLALLTLHILVHAVLSCSKTVFVFVVGLMMIAFIFFPGPAYVGGVTLRALGLGGGLPITIFLKSNPSNAVIGCLVLSTGNQMIVTNSGCSKKDCSSVAPRLKSATTPGSGQSAKKIAASAVAYERSDVLRSIVSLRVVPK